MNNNLLSYGSVMDENNNLAYLLTYINYWPINFNSSQILAYIPLSPKKEKLLLNTAITLNPEIVVGPIIYQINALF